MGNVDYAEKMGNTSRMMSYKTESKESERNYKLYNTNNCFGEFKSRLDMEEPVNKFEDMSTEIS